ncbi:exodeoxyribonuclease V subunit gamma [Kineosporia rhizophila]|uniref:exodeoxyribonuclease V subunit gamma n=1 Tax=Kineosporia rhizophila TaxID=84633 RepID=UPI001E607D08|nr:exodeoxyribonuclease V subunit gamma [Kineosporia rhizophila]
MLTVHRCADGTGLALALAGLLAEPLEDPFAVETVAVPAKGVERWLTQRLSHVLGTGTAPTTGTPAAPDGVCANVSFPSSTAVLERALEEASDQIARAVRAWAPDRSRWSLTEVIDASRAEPWCAPLDRHLKAGEQDTGRRLAAATRLARLFDEYGNARPGMITAWAQGRDESGDGRPLPDDLLWQAELWRRLRERLGVPAPAELLDEACARLRDEPATSTLPQRLSVFGASRLSPLKIRVLAALAEHRDVHLWLHHPSPALWEVTSGLDPAALPLRRSDDPARTRVRNPLLASMSRDLLELQQTLIRYSPQAGHREHPAPEPPDTLLGRLKRDLRRGEVHDVPERPVLHPDDTSIQVHSCYGRVRQVEVLREVMLGLLADDPTLEPRDILVMCPDVEAFAPLVTSAFAQSDQAGQLRVRVADRSPRQTNALFDLLGLLLELGTARITAPQVLDLAGREAVRRRFGFDDDDLARLRDWLVGAGIRWGLDDAHRQTWHLQSIQQGTWRAGLDRLLLGVSVEGDTEQLGGVIGLDDVDSAGIDLAGRLAELIDRLGAAQELMSGRHPIAKWLTGLENSVLDLGATDRNTAWQVNQLRSELWDVAEAAADSQADCSLADVRSVLADLLAGRPTRSSFRTGTLTVCTLVPMRSVPHRVVCLLGLDDGSFPRRADPDGDDVLGRDPWVGERDPRSEDRQLFLDAVCAAQEKLVITYSGSDDRTGAPIPPAVPLGELLDAVDRSSWLDDRRVRDRITVRHPLQPFDPRNFTDGALGRPGPFSFDEPALEGARALTRERVPSGRFLPAPLPPAGTDDVALADLHRLLQHPAKGFLRQRLQVSMALADEEPDDALPVELDSLQQWKIGDRLLRQRLSGLSPADCIAVESHRGLLPPGDLGRLLLTRVGRKVEDVMRASTLERAAAPDSRDVDVLLPDGTRLTGTVGDVRDSTVLTVTYSRLGPKHRLGSWVNLLALTATDPAPGWSAVTVGQGPRGGAARSVFEPLDQEMARLALAELVGLYRAGLSSPLPITLKTSASYAERRLRGTRHKAAEGEAARLWHAGKTRQGQRFDGEQSEPEHCLIYGSEVDFPVLLAEPPTPDEQGEGWVADEPHRFGRLSRRLWDRLLTHERLEGR